MFIQGNFKETSNNNKSSQPRDLVNDQVRFPSVLLIGPNGESLGTMSSREAQLKANELELDLFCVNPNGNPPVCKILNYSKHRYEQQKKAKENRKNQKIIELKEIRLTPVIGLNDMKTKAKAASKFLQEGNKVQVTVKFKGRQLAHIDVGEEVLGKFIEMIAEYGDIEKTAVMDGKWMKTILAPKKK